MARKTKARTLDTDAARMSYKDVLVLYMKEGVERVRALYESEHVTARVLRRAIKEMPEGAAADLRAYIDANVPMIHEGRGRGRALPIVGEVRKYKVQQLRDGQLFVRLPVEPLDGITKGSIIRVSFQKNQILASM